MFTLRFANPELQAQFLAGVRALPFDVDIAPDGTVSCTQAQWPIVNGVAHRLRDGCFPWYFTSRHTPEDAAAFEQYLNARALRYQLEHHRDGPVFVLPRADRSRHCDFGGPEACSFCGETYPPLTRLFGTYVAAICDVCVREFHTELASDPPDPSNT
jgi:hypothetical protein